MPEIRRRLPGWQPKTVWEYPMGFNKPHSKQEKIIKTETKTNKTSNPPFLSREGSGRGGKYNVMNSLTNTK